MYIPPGGGDVRPPLGKPNAEILPQTFESGNHEPNCHESKNGRNCFFRKKRTHVPFHYTQKPGPSSQTGVEVVCNAFTTKVQNWTFFMSELIHCPSTFMSVSPRPIFCAVRGGPCRTPAQPPAATSAALPIFAKPQRFAGFRERGPPVSSQNRKDSPILGRAALVAAGRGVGGRTGTRPSRIFAKPQRFVGFREGRACRGRERSGRTRGNASLPRAASGG